MVITSLSNNKVKQLVKYHDKKYRELDQVFLVEGEHLIKEALNANVLLEVIIVENTSIDINFDNITYVNEEVMKKISFTKSSYNIIGMCRYMDTKVSIDYNKVIILDDLQDPGNIGTIIRSACSFGFDCVIISNRGVDLYNDKLIRSTQGAIFNIPVIQTSLVDEISKLKKSNVEIIATDLHQSYSLNEYKVSEKFALVMGNEGSGVSEEILNLADVRVKIPMKNFESLNVAVAAGICMFKLGGL